MSYFSYKEYMKKTFGRTLHVVPIDLDFGCPNRDANGFGGCAFCPTSGAKAIQTTNIKDPKEQLKTALKFAQNRYKATNFMLYIQAYSATFASLIKQKKAYEALLGEHDFKAISLGTRPDCLSNDVLKYLSELNRKIPVFIDLGVQSLNDATLKKINRAHSATCSLDAIKKLHAHKIKVFAHMIIGLPNETRKDWAYTATTLSSHGVSGIKIHNLHVIKNTALAKNPPKTLSEYEYLEELLHVISHIKPQTAIIRTTTDTLTSELIAPKWHISKGEFLTLLKENLKARKITQGCRLLDLSPFYKPQKRFTCKHFTTNKNLLCVATKGESKIKTTTCDDGFKTFWSTKYRAFFHPKSGANAQAKLLFDLPKSQNLKILDIGFGMGAHSLHVINQRAKNPKISTHIDAVEFDLSALLRSAKMQKNQTLLTLYMQNFWQSQNTQSSITLHVGDARHTLKTLDEGAYDYIFLDPFFHTFNPSLLSFEFLQMLKKLLKKDGTLIATTTCKPLKNALNALNFSHKTIQQKDIKGLIATKNPDTKTQEPKTRFYRDPYLLWSEKTIIKRYEKNT